MKKPKKHPTPKPQTAPAKEPILPPATEESATTEAPMRAPEVGDSEDD